MTFKVFIAETLSKKVFVEAEDKKSAINKVTEMYDKEIIILDADDFINVTFEVSKDSE